MPQAVARVLLVEDNAADAEVTSDMLAFARTPRCELTCVARLEEALALVARERFDVALLDLGLPGVTGLDGVKALRGAAVGTAIIVLSGHGSESVAVEALAIGAQDYLVKGRADEDALQRSIRFAIARREADVAQRLLAAVVESSEDAIFTVDLQLRLTTWNAGAQRLFGHARGEVLGRSVGMLVPADRAGEDRAVLARVLAGEHVQGFETRRLRRGGTPVDVSLSVSAIPDDHGNVIALAAIARDITDSTHAAAALRAAQERFRIAFEEAPIGMGLIGLDRRFMKVNVAFTQITGYAASELEGSDWAVMAHPGDSEHEGAALRALLAGTEPHSADRHFFHADGHPIWVALNITCVRDEKGHPQHFLAQMQDITARHRYEEQLQHMADHDPLSGLLNRRAFERELRAHTDRGERYGIGGAALMIDIDRFKSYNDSRGHQAGDELIARFARALAGRLRKSDVLARLGGDEFAVILPSADAAAAGRVANELLDCVRGDEVAGADDPLTASIGVALFDDLGRLPEDVVADADGAMYVAKAAGGDRVCFHPVTTRVGDAGP
jgi:diguanylate cyclase (GGDEF)-like protein/PAS domain S-box-containing protein